MYGRNGYGNEKTLMEIAYAYEQQAGANIRRMPERTPALQDKKLNAFMEDLMEQAYSIDYSKYNKKSDGKVQLMLNACDKAKNVDLKDPYAAYEAAEYLAAAYDRVMAALEESGIAETWSRHRYGTPAWTWKGMNSATAKFTCKDDSSHTRTLTAKVTSKITKKATVSAAGVRTYTASVTLNGKTYTSRKVQNVYLFSKKTTGLKKYNKILYYTKKGLKCSSFTGFAKYGSGWYYVEKGRVPAKKTGLIKGKVNGKKGNWYCKAGKVQTGFTGKKKIKGRIYKIRKGKVV